MPVPPREKQPKCRSRNLREPLRATQSPRRHLSWRLRCCLLSFYSRRRLNSDRSPLGQARTTLALRPAPIHLRLAMTISTISSLPPPCIPQKKIINNRYRVGGDTSVQLAGRSFRHTSLPDAFNLPQAPVRRLPR